MTDPDFTTRARAVQRHLLVPARIPRSRGRMTDIVQGRTITRATVCGAVRDGHEMEIRDLGTGRWYVENGGCLVCLASEVCIRAIAAALSPAMRGALRSLVSEGAVSCNVNTTAALIARGLADGPEYGAVASTDLGREVARLLAEGGA